jgi:hypothetical protein
VQRRIQLGHPLVGPIDGQAVLNEIIRAEREKVCLASEQIGAVSRRRNLDHDADRYARDLETASNQVCRDVGHDVPAEPQLVDSGDEGEHDAQGAVLRRPKQRSDLRLKPVGPTQTESQTPQALASSAFRFARPRALRLLPRRVMLELLFVDVERSHRDSPRCHACEHASVDLVLLVLAGVGGHARQQELRTV